MSNCRCDWVKDTELSKRYHDEEWGVPEFSSLKLFEFLILEGLQAGLSWDTILLKRAAFRQHLAHFDPLALSQFTETDIARCMQEKSIVRNRLKLEAVVKNARAYLKLQESTSGFSDFLWQWTDGKPIQNAWQRSEDIPTQTVQSVSMSNALKKAGFSFVGPTICYAMMQAIGMVNDHLTKCFRYAKVIIP